MTLWSLITGFIGGIGAWFLTTALAQPFQKFVALRQEAAVALVDFEDRLWIGNPDAKPPTEEWLVRRLSAYDKAGTNLVAFAASNSFFVRLLRQPILGHYRCYIGGAGENLRVLAATYPGTAISVAHYENVLRQLRIVTGPAKQKRGQFGNVLLLFGLAAWALTAAAAAMSLSENRYAREPNAILKALAVTPPAGLVLLATGVVLLTIVGTVLGADHTNRAQIWLGFRRRWKGFSGLILLASVAIAIGTRSSIFWR